MRKGHAMIEGAKSSEAYGHLSINTKKMDLIKINDFYFELPIASKIIAIFLKSNLFCSLAMPLFNVLFKISRKMYHLDALVNSTCEPKDPNRIITENDFSVGYDENAEVKRFFSNREGVIRKVEVGLLDRFRLVINEINHIIIDDPSVKKVSTIGCSYAYSESVIADKNDGVIVSGFDRSDYTAKLNRIFLCKNNLRFYSGNLFEYIDAICDESTIFNHTWTTAYFTKPMLETLYLQLQNKSVKYIVVVEPVGISIETGSLINLGEFDVPSIALTCNNVNQHNYIGALRKANYNILKSSLVNIPYQKYKHLLLVVASLED